VSFLYCENIIDIIKKYEVKGSKFGLERTRNLLNALGSPDDNLKIIHVAGTNGKGSLCEYVSQILLAAGKRVGTFTSPEVYCYGEKFKINCDQIPDEKLKEYLSYVYTLSLKFEDKPTAFEIETATALYAFFKEGCEYAVVECGMGGLNDSTNAINKKQVAAITSVSLEHTAVLGKTISEICSQKAGIIKNCPAIVSAFQADEGLKFFSKLSVKFAGEGLSVIKICEDGQEFLYDGESYKIKMFGLAQAYNASVAIEVARALGIKLPYIKAGLERAQLSGRIEKIKRGGTTYILDGSHNPASFAPLLECVQNSTLSKTLVFGCLSDKDVDSIAKMLGEQFKKSYVFAPPSYRAMDGQKIYGTFSKYIKDTTLCKSVSDALAKANDELVVVCGSFTLLKEAKEWIEKRQ
jgi:dihydrofolate synthase/folylpolyglutamate synthase